MSLAADALTVLSGSLVGVVGAPSTHIAIGTSTVALSAPRNLAGHARAGNVKWPCALVFAAIVATVVLYVIYRGVLAP